MTAFKLSTTVFIIYALAIGLDAYSKKSEDKNSEEKNGIQSNEYQLQGLMPRKIPINEIPVPRLRKKRWLFQKVKNIIYHYNPHIVYVVMETNDGNFVFVPTTLTQRLPIF